MNNKFTIYGTILDNGHKDHYFVRFDTLANRMTIYHLIGLLGDDNKKNLKEIKNIFKEDADHTLFVSSDLLVQLVDALGGIRVNGRKINGAKALEEIRNDNIAEVASGVSHALSGNKNLLFAIPGLLSSLKGNYETDLNIVKVVRTALEEAGDLKDWKADLIKVDKDNVNSI